MEDAVRRSMLKTAHKLYRTWAEVQGAKLR